MINAGNKGLTTEVLSAQVVRRQIRQAGEGGVGGGEVSMGLCRYRISRVERTVGDDAGRESGYGSARADADVTGNLAGAAIRYR